MKSIFFALSVVCIAAVSCAHNETPSPSRTPSSDPYYSANPGHAQWENDVCVLKGQSKEQDYVVRFSDVHTYCPPLRDYAPAGIAYSKLKTNGRGVHLPSCLPQPVQARSVASQCWMGFDVFGKTAGACSLSQSQAECSECQCNGKKGIAWQ